MSINPSTTPTSSVASPRRLSPQERLAAVRDLGAFVTRSIPLSWLVDGITSRLSALFDAPVVSLYLLEDGGRTLVMRGNVGFSDEAVGAIRLSAGEGVTGLAVESRCPIVVADGPAHERFKGFPDLAEDSYPIFAAIPLLADLAPLGALVLQRPERRFSSVEVELLVALSAGIASAIRQLGATDESVWLSGPHRRAGGGTRRAMLQGRTVVGGRVLGPLAAIRRPPRRALATQVDDPQSRVLRAFEQARARVRGLTLRARELELGADAGFLTVYQEVLEDERLRARTLGRIAQGASIPAALGQIAADAVRAASRITRDAFMEQRARDIEDLCDAIGMMALSDRRATMPRGAIVIGDVVTVYDLLVTARSRPVGVALTERAGDKRVTALLRLLNLPAVVDVGGMFRWVADGDMALLDAAQGFLLVNPTRSEVGELEEGSGGRASKTRDEFAA